MPDDPREQEERDLVSELLERLEERGVPQGAWLVEIAQVRDALRRADSLLRKLEDAIIRDVSSPPPEP